VAQGLQASLARRCRPGITAGRRRRSSLEEATMKSNAPVSSSVSWLEQQYCGCVAATLLARTEFFELLEDATISPARLARARTAWQQHAATAQTLKGLFGTA
jgi:hypothetical protein